MDETEIRRLTEQMLDEMRTTGTVTTDTLKKFNEATSVTSKGLQGLGKASSATAHEIGSFTRGLAQGSTNFEQFNSMLGRMSEGIAKALEGIPFAGGVLAGGIRAVGESAKFMMTQMDSVAKSYQDLGSVAANTATGVSGLQDRFNKLGLVSLPTFTKSVIANNFALTAFRGNLGKGSDDLAEIFGNITTTQGDQFQKLGMTIDNVAESSANYIAAQSRYGFSQTKTNKQLTESAIAYIREQDVLTRLTGQAAKAQEDEQKKSLANVAFRATMVEMEANGQEKAAKQLQLFINSLPPPLAEAARGTLSGIPLTQAAQDAQILMGNVLGEALQNIKNGGKATTEMGKVFDASSQAVQGWNRYLQVAPESFSSLGTSIYDLDAINKRAIKEGKTREQVEKEIRIEQQKLMNSTDPLTKGFVDTQNALISVQKDLQAFSFALMPYGVAAVNKFADALFTAIEKMAEIAGIQMPNLPGRQTKKLEEAQKPATSMSGAPLHVPGGMVGGATNQANIKIDAAGAKVLKDSFDFKAEKVAIQSGMPTANVNDEQLKKMAEFYRREAAEELEKSRKAMAFASNEQDRLKEQIKVINLEKQFGGKEAADAAIARNRALPPQPTTITERILKDLFDINPVRVPEPVKPTPVPQDQPLKNGEQEDPRVIAEQLKRGALLREQIPREEQRLKILQDELKAEQDKLATGKGTQSNVDALNREIISTTKSIEKLKKSLEQRESGSKAGSPGVTPAAAPANVRRDANGVNLPGVTPAAAPAKPNQSGANASADPFASLNLKSRESVAGGAVDPRLLSLAQKIQDTYPNATFTALNDLYHQKNMPGSKHTIGQALDFTLDPAPRDSNEAAAIKKIVQGLGFSSVKDEYFADKNKFTRGGHIHAELAKGGITTGPSLAGEAGPEAVVPLPGGRKIPVEFGTRTFEGLIKSLTQLNTNFSILNKKLVSDNSSDDTPISLLDSYLSAINKKLVNDKNTDPTSLLDSYLSGIDKKLANDTSRNAETATQLDSSLSGIDKKLANDTSRNAETATQLDSYLNDINKKLVNDKNTAPTSLLDSYLNDINKKLVNDTSRNAETATQLDSYLKDINKKLDNDKNADPTSLLDSYLKDINKKLNNDTSRNAETATQLDSYMTKSMEKLDFAALRNNIEVSEFDTQPIEKAMTELQQQNIKMIESLMGQIKESMRTPIESLDPVIVATLQSIDRNTSTTNNISSRILQVSQN